MEATNAGDLYRYELNDILYGTQYFRNLKLVNILNKLSFAKNYAEGKKEQKKHILIMMQHHSLANYHCGFEQLCQI